MSNFRRFLSSVFPASAVRRTPAGYRLQIETMEARVVPASLVIGSLEDTVRVDGKITLREAILSANANAPVNADVPSGSFGRDTIDIPTSLVGTLNLTAPLPALSDNTGLVINGQPRFVVNAAGAGSAPVVVNSANNEVRGLTIQASLSSGIVLNPGARNTIVAGNRIGTNADGLVVPGSGNAGSGIVIAGASSTTVNGNIIGGNGGAGVSVTGNATGYSVLGNVFQSNGGPAIDVGGDGAGTTSAAPASRTTSPIITQVVPTSATVRTVYGTAYGISGTTQRLEFYTAAAFDANGLAQGQTMVGTANVLIGPSGTGAFTFNYAPVANQPMLTATATDGAGNTSEFSGRNKAPSITSPAERTLPAGAGNLVFDGANAITVVDPGNTGTGPIRARVYSTNGTVTLGNLSGVGIETGTNGSTGVTVTGTLAGVNRALAGLTFTPAPGFSGRATVGIRVDDFGGDAIGGTLSIERNTFITVSTATTPPNPGGGTGGTGGTGTGGTGTGTVVAAPVVTVSPASGNVGTPIALNISVTLATNNATDRINTIGIKNLPAGATLSAGTRLSDGSWLLTQAQLTGLTITSPTAGSFDLSVSATTRTTLNDSINATTRALTLTVVPVSNGGTGTVVAAPIVAVSPASGNVGTPIALNISVTLATNNATDRINTIGIKNLPAGATLSAGTRLSDGSWLLTQAQLTGLTITSPIAGTFGLSVSATTRTTLNDSINATTKSLTLTVVTGGIDTATPVAAPVVTVSTAIGDVGSPIPLNITVTLATSNSTDRIDNVTIRRLPAEGTLSAGTRQSDGSWVLTPAQLTGLTITSPASGVFDLQVTATSRTTRNDSVGITSKVLTLSVGNTAPVVSIGTSGSNFPRNAVALFSGSFTDTGRTTGTWSYVWNAVSSAGQIVAPLSGVTTGVGSIPTFFFTPTLGGQYTITLTVTDAFGASGSATRVIGVETPEPVATITAGPSSTAQGQQVTFSGVVGSPLTNAGPFSYVWTATPPTGAAVVAEGRVDNAGGVPDFRFTPGPGGNWTVTLRVRDASGTASQPSTRNLSVTNVAPVAVIASGPGSVNEGETATFTGSFNDPAGAAAGGYTYLWSVRGADGQIVTTQPGSIGADGSVPSFSVAPPRSGTYTVSLTVTDREGASNTASRGLTAIDIKPTVTIVGAASLVSGNSATYTGTFTDPGADGPYSYEWTLTAPNKAPIISNGPLANGQAVPVLTFTGTDVGNYSVSLTIRDRDGNSTTQTFLVNVTAATTPPITSPPLVTIVGPVTGVEGSPLTFRGIQLDNSLVSDNPTYTWTVTSTNGQTDKVTGSVGASFRVPDYTLTPYDNGTYTVSLTVTRGGVTSAPDSIVVEVSNVAPAPTILSGTQTVAIGSAATFSGSFTDPAGAYDANYSWVWTATGPNGDNQTLTGTSAQPGAVGDFKFIPASKGVYSISLRVTDVDGGTTLSQSAQMLVTSVPVVTSINGGPSSGSEGTAVSYTGSFTDPVGVRAGGYRVRWTAVGSNGQSEVSESLVTTPGASSFTFTPRSGATYTVQMSVSDVDGTTTSSTQTLTVANVAPTATITDGPTTSVEGTAVSFLGSLSDPGLTFDGPYTYTWTATSTNGQTANAQGVVTGPGGIPAFAVTPNDNGTYTITLTVQDRDGLTSTATRTMVVSNVAPTATFTSGGKIAQGNAATFTFGSAADASSVDAAGLTYSYDFTNSGTFTAASGSPTASHIYAETGTYTVRGRVTDKDGAFTDYTTTIKVGARDIIVAGAGPGGGPHVRVLDAANGAEKMSFFAYDPAFRGGVSVASGDVNGDGVADIVTAVASGGGPHVKVFDGVSGQVIASFYAYDSGFGGGVTVAVGDVNNDGRADIIVGTGPSAAPHVKVIDARKLDLVDSRGTIAEAALLQSFYAFDKGFNGGVTVASGDIDKDGFADVVVGAGAGGGPAVGVYSGATGRQIASFYAFDPMFFGGANVSVGDLNGDGFGDIIVGAGPGAGARVIGIDGTRVGEMVSGGTISENALLRSFMAYDASFRAGVRVGAADRDGDGISEILTGPQGSSSERVFAYSGKPTQPKEAFDVFAGFNGGVSLG